MSDVQNRRSRHWALYRMCLGGGFWLLLCTALALFRSSLPPLTEIAPLLALAIAGEELVVRQQARSGGTVLSFSAIAHIAAAIVVGPLAAAAVAAFAVVIVDGLRPAGRRLVLINSAMLGSSIWIAGECYLFAGGTSSLVGLHSLLPLFALVSSRYLLTTFVYVVGAALSSGRSASSSASSSTIAAKARATSGWNCVSALSKSSAAASSRERAGRYGRFEVIASKLSAATRTCASIGISDPGTR